ncbi:MAG: hypothetical protein C5B60_07790 [Chloroflexi bacterium]|nr:MAG: hypothetical protein C5B60_07790 [Chloroflexota bacterium]
MGQILGPYGLRIIKNLGEQYFTGGMKTYRIVNPAAIATTGCYFGDPVGLQGGSVVPLSTSPTPGVPGSLGIFQGCSWQDPFRGFVNAQFLPAGIFSSGASDVQVKVMDYPFAYMRVQANGSIQLNQVGLNASLGNFGNGSIFTGNSRVFLDQGTLGAGPLAVRIVDFIRDAAPSPGAGSMPGDPYTDVIVLWNFSIHRYQNATGG